MSLNRSTALMAMMALLSCGLSPRAAQAGPLLDWLFGRSHTAPAQPVGPPVPVGNGYSAGYGVAPVVGQAPTVAYPAANYAGGYAGNYGTYYSSQLPVIGPAGAGYTAPMPSGIAAATLPSSMPPTLSYVPNFQTQSQRTPVTYYRPLMTTDPNTGAQVVAMAPCTSYEMMAQRVPVLGRSALFGSNTAPTFQPPAQTLPTYTLPSGGLPLAYSTPSITAPYSTAYGVYGSTNTAGSYSTLQPGITQTAPSVGTMAPSSVGPAGSYPTAPLAQTPYYGSDNGGSCGDLGATPWQPVPGGTPGLVAPQAPPSQYPSQWTPEFSPVPNGTVAPPINTAPGVYPPSSGGSVDPGDVRPTLPSLGTSAASAPQFNAQQFNSQHSDSALADPSSQASQRPQVRSIVRYPSSPAPVSGQTSQSNAATATTESGKDHGGDYSDMNRESRGDIPAMLPIPAPQDFQHEPRWNPGLLREEDMTALRAIDSRAAQLAGHAKPIVWASFESPSRGISPAEAVNQSQAVEHYRSAEPQTLRTETGSATSLDNPQNNQLRSIVNSSTAPQTMVQPLQSPAGIQRLPESRLMPPRDESVSAPRTQRDASGWKASR